MNHYFTDNRQLAQNRKDLSFRFSCFNLTFTSDSGVFCKDKIDEGSKIFLETLAKQSLGKKMLDVGCGYGVLGITLKKCFAESHVDMIDVNPRAVELAQLNAKQNQCDVNICISNLYEQIHDCDYSDIITNPPIRAGKKVIYEIFRQAYDHLLEEGCLWVVIRKQQGALSAQKYIASIFNNCEVIHKEKGYFILKAKK